MKRRPGRAFETQSAAQALGRVLAGYGLSDEIRGNRVMTEWAELVGPRVAARTRPDGISERVLWVEVATSAWLHELSLLKAQLLAGLIERLGEPRLFDDVRFKLAGKSRREQTTIPKPRAAAPGPLPVGAPATGARREQIVAETAQVDDEELRELIARVRITNDR